VRSVRRYDVLRTPPERKQQGELAFCPSLPSPNGSPAIRPIPSSFYKSANAGGR